MLRENREFSHLSEHLLLVCFRYLRQYEFLSVEFMDNLIYLFRLWLNEASHEETVYCCVHITALYGSTEVWLVERFVKLIEHLLLLLNFVQIHVRTQLLANHLRCRALVSNLASIF